MNQLVFSSKLKAHSKKIDSICFSNNNQFLASASKDKTIKVWQLELGKFTKTILLKSDYANSIAFDRDNKILISGEKDSTIKLWSLQHQKLIHTFIRH